MGYTQDSESGAVRTQPRTRLFYYPRWLTLTGRGLLSVIDLVALIVIAWYTSSMGPVEIASLAVNIGSTTLALIVDVSVVVTSYINIYGPRGWFTWCTFFDLSVTIFATVGFILTHVTFAGKKTDIGVAVSFLTLAVAITHFISFCGGIFSCCALMRQNKNAPPRT